MDYSEFRKQYNILMDKYHDIGNQIIRLKRQYVNSLPIKEDDIITVKDKQCQIKLIRLLPNSSKVELIVKPLKKDGTVSKKLEYAYISIDDIEKYATNKSR